MYEACGEAVRYGLSPPLLYAWEVDTVEMWPPKADILHDWAYKIRGPFAAANFAQGAYCVLSTLHFLAEYVLGHSITWVPSFRLRTDQGKKEVETDFAVFVKPSRFTHASEPFLVLGECKSLNLFESKDFSKARYLAKSFPQAAICFSTFRENLSEYERKMLTKIVRRGRAALRTGEYETRLKYPLSGDKKCGKLLDR